MQRGGGENGVDLPDDGLEGEDAAGSGEHSVDSPDDGLEGENAAGGGETAVAHLMID